MNDESPSSWKERARTFYDREAAAYQQTSYGEDPERYPANSIRLKHVLSTLRAAGTSKVLDVGCGSGYPLAVMLDEGIDAVGFDFSEPMVSAARDLLEGRGHDPDRASVGDAEDPATFPAGPFDAVTALGVFPHVLSEPRVIRNMAGVLGPGGLFVAEFRNGLFSAFTLNRYSFDFFLESFFDSVGVLEKDSALRHRAEEFYRTAFQLPAASESPDHDATPSTSYAELLTRFHNPLTVGELLAPAGLEWQRNIFYHFHAAPPAVEESDRAEFRARSLEMEFRFSDDWRGLFMASAFVAVAGKR